MPGTLTDRFDVANLDQWGRLIKSWATNLDYVTQDYPFQPPRAFWVNTTWPQEAAGPPSAETVPDRDQKNNPQAWTLPQMKPVNVEGTNDTYVALPFAVALSSVEFTDRLTAASVVGVHMPTQYKNVIVVQGDKDTMVIRLPPRDTLQGSEDDLINDNPYPFRDFYQPLYGGAAPTPPVGRVNIMRLHANRIGEYTLNNCA